MGLLNTLIWYEVFSTLDKKIDREVIREGGCNLFFGIESVGGKLFLTKDSLLFYSHGINISSRRKYTVIDLNEITDVEKCNTLLIVPNGIKVYTNSKTYQFILYSRSKWIEIIKSTCQNNKDQLSNLLMNSKSKISNSKYDYDILEQIKKLSQLKDEGVLTLKEFENKKTELLDKL